MAPTVLGNCSSRVKSVPESALDPKPPLVVTPKAQLLAVLTVIVTVGGSQAGFVALAALSGWAVCEAPVYDALAQESSAVLVIETV